MTKTIRRIAPRQGYDRWSATYDATDSSLVALDRRETLPCLHPRPGERILDAGCGTGVHLATLEEVGARPVGIDVSVGMLNVARRRCAQSSLIQADLDRGVPLVSNSFDAVLSTLVSEHLGHLDRYFGELFRVLRPGGRLVFSAFHPELAEAGVEARFEQGDVEYRLGAALYTVEDYLDGMRHAGFLSLEWREVVADRELARRAPSAVKRLGQKLLLLIQAQRPGDTGT